MINVSAGELKWDTVIYCTLRRLIDPDEKINIYDRQMMNELVRIPGYTFLYQERQGKPLSYDLYKTQEIATRVKENTSVAHAIKRRIDDRYYLLGCILADRTKSLEDRIKDLTAVIDGYGTGEFVKSLGQLGLSIEMDDIDKKLGKVPEDTMANFLKDFTEIRNLINQTNETQRPWLLLDRIRCWQYAVRATPNLLQYVGEPKEDGYHIYCKEIPKGWAVVGKIIGTYEIVVRDKGVAEWIIENTPLNMVRIFGEDVCKKMDVL